jgi:DNA-binding Lrp family transcriptional regulator
MLDDIDRTLQVLQRDGQVSYAELGGHVRLSASAVNDRLKRHKGNGVLQRITIQRTHSIIALFSAKETREIDTTVPGTGQ